MSLVAAFRSRETYAEIGTHLVRQVLIVLFLVIVNPFHLTSQGDEWLLQQWQTLYAEQYGEDHALGTNDSPSGLETVTVLTITEEEEREMAAPRPVDTFDYAEKLKLIGQLARFPDPGAKSPSPPRGPRAIFLDMFLDHALPEAKTPAEAARPWELTAKERGACEQGRSNPTFTPFRCALDIIAGMTQYDKWAEEEDCQTNPVAKIACIRRHGGIPVVFAVARHPAAGDGPPERTRGEAALERIAVGAPVELAYSRYWLVSPHERRLRERRPFDLSPAAALYWAHCALPGKSDPPMPQPQTAVCKGSPVEAPSTLATDPVWRRGDQGWNWSTGFERPLEPIWAIGREDDFTNALTNVEAGTRPTNCRVAAGRGTSLFLAIMGEAFAGLRSEDEAARPLPETLPCPYPHTLTLSELSAVSPELLRLGLNDRIILIGRAGASNDVVEAAAIGKLPGVYLHAMALQNLIDQGQDYGRAPQRYVSWLNFNDRDLVAMIPVFWLAFIGAVTRVSLRALRSAEDVPNRLHRIARVFGVLTLFAMLAVPMPLFLLWLGGDPAVSMNLAAMFDRPIPSRFSQSAIMLALVLNFTEVVIELSEPLFENLRKRGWFWRLVLGNP